MNKSNTISKFSFFLFALFYNYLFYNIFFVPRFYDYYGRNSFLIFLFQILIGFLVFLVIPKKKVESDALNDMINTKIYRIIFGIYLVIRASTLIVLASHIMSEEFYVEQQSYGFIILFTLIINYISQLRIVGIVNISTIIYILIIPFIILAYVFYPTINIYNIIPFQKINFEIFTPIYIFAGIVDLLVMIFFNTKTKTFFTKKRIIIAFSACSILFSIESLSLINIFGDKFLINFKNTGFMIYQVQKIYKYIGKFDFIYIYIITICCLMKASYFLSLSRIMFKMKKKKYTYFLTLFMLGGFVLLVNYYYGLLIKESRWIITSIAAFLLIFYLWIIFRRSKNAV